MLLTIAHRTVYRYTHPVTLLPHRMMLCPRGQQDLRLLTMRLRCTPPAEIEWTQDVFGNVIATARFAGAVETLTVDSRMTVEQWASAWPVFTIAPSAHQHPFDYSPDEIADLGALRHRQDGPEAASLRAWVDGIRGGGPADTLTLLKQINAGICSGLAYRARDAEGTQSPAETIRSGSGSCRDFATLFIAAVRQLGFGARAVSGYLHVTGPDERDGGAQHGTTHAWAEVYLPCAGWIAFDPTHARVGGAGLIPVAVARDIQQITPVQGRYLGGPEQFLDMAVEVTVTADRP